MERTPVLVIYFVQWLWPTVFCLLATLFNPYQTPVGWLALAVGLLLFQGYRWLDQRPVFPPLWSSLGTLLVLILVALVAVPLPFNPVQRALSQALVFIGMGTLLRGISLGWSRHSRGPQRAMQGFLLLVLLAEFTYLMGWLFLAWLTLPPGLRVGTHWGKWFRTPFPVLGLISGFHFVFLHLAQHVNPEHEDGTQWLQATARNALVGIIVSGLAGMGLWRLPRVWWLQGLLWMYAYRTYTYTRGSLQRMRDPEEAPDASGMPWSHIVYRWVRQTLYFGVVLLALLYLHYAK